VVKSGTIARCEGWNWKSPVDDERISWFTSSSAQPTVPVNGRQIGSGPSITLDSSMLRGENGRYLICQVTGSKDGFEAHFTASKYLTTPAAPTLSYVSINASSLTTGGNATCSFNSYSENESTRVDWGYTSVSGYFTLYPGLSGEKIQITRDLAQQAAGKYLACRVTLINSGGEVSKSANTYNTFASLPNAPSVSVSINGAVSAGSTARCSASASYDFGTNLTYAWGKTSSNGSRSIEGEVYSRSTSYTLTSSSLDNLAGAFLTCVVTLENDVGSVSSASSISIPNSQITIPQPTAPTVETQTASSTSISVKIRVPSISGFDGSKMVAKLNVVNAPNCTNLTVNPGSTYDCAGLSANTTYTANISVASISGQVVQKTSSNLSFTTIGLGSLQTPAAPTFTPISPTEVRVALPGIPGFNSSTMSAQLYIYYQTSLSALGIDGAASTVTVRELAAGKTHTGYIVLRSLISGSEVKSSVVTFTLLSGATINPTFSSTTSTLDGFTFQITNYDSTYTWSASVEASSQPGAGAAISNSGLVRISGMTANASANIIVRASKAGIDAGSNSISGRSLNSTDNQLRVLVSDPDSSGVSNISFCFTNPESLSGYVNWTSPQIGSGSFLKHSGTPACPNPAGVSVGQRLTAATTYTFSVSASNNGRNYSDSVTITTPGDRQPPTISSGTVAPSSISVGQNITVRFRATDQVRVSSCRATVYNRNNIDTVTNSSCSKVSGDELDGIWQVSINLNSSNGPGAYTVKASATDSSGNTSLLTEVGTFSIAGPSVSNLGTLPTPRTIGINYVDQIVLNGFNLGSLGVDPGGYIWTVRIQNSSNQFVKTEPVGSNQTYITGLAGGTTYNVYLVATDSAGATKLSLPLAVTTLAPAWTPPADSNTAIYDDTYTRICLSQNWTNCGSWTIYNETGMVVNRIVGPIPFTFCQTSGVNVCGGSPKGFAVLTGRYYAPIPAAPSLWKESYPLNGSVIPPGRGGTWEIGVTGATTLSLIASSPDAPSIVANFSQSWGGNVVISTASYANQPGVLLYKGALFVPSGTPNTTFTLTWTATNSAGITTTFTGGTFRTSE
jgi:hypothetical protein